MADKKNTFEAYSDAELQAELARRENERRQIAVRERADHIGKVVKHINEILPLLSHSRNSCTDAKPVNAERGCSRCFALDVSIHSYMDDDFILEINFRKSPIRNES